jgi:hypothetical protein
VDRACALRIDEEVSRARLDADRDQHAESGGEALRLCLEAPEIHAVVQIAQLQRHQTAALGAEHAERGRRGAHRPRRQRRLEIARRRADERALRIAPLDRA